MRGGAGAEPEMSSYTHTTSSARASTSFRAGCVLLCVKTLQIVSILIIYVKNVGYHRFEVELRSSRSMIGGVATPEP